jgi:GT2 family glycosyltransferase
VLRFPRKKLKGEVVTPEIMVSAVVVNWNGARHLETCLPSLLSQSYRQLEIIVVDNDSADDSVEVARSFGVRWIPLDTNAGLAPALNKGAEAAVGEFILFLNNDMRFHHNFVESMIISMARDPNVFSVDALQYDWDGNNEVHLATRLATHRGVDSLSYPMVPSLYVFQENCVSPTVVLMASAANMLVRKSMFRILGGFDERLPLGYEDVEICWRAWVRGWKSVFAPAAICWHRVSASIESLGEGSRMSFRGIYYGRLLMATKLLPVRYIIMTWFVTVAGLTSDIAGLRWQRVADRLRMLTAFINDLGPLLRQRHQIFGAERGSPSQHLNRLLQLSAQKVSEIGRS